ncbi:hypothetical protein AAVH_28395 [Aphelenchoides avenae]|nr:hypothetical protein AAVH_28395 [Aphelenchus avenae]
MHPALFYESFFFCPRDDLERLQPLSQTLLDIIVRGSNVLPLRPIYYVNMDFDEDAKDSIQIFLEQDKDADEQLSDYEASLRDGDFGETFFRLQHICVKCFYVGIRGSPFLDYWKVQEAASFTAVRIEFDTTTEYALLDSIINHLHPRNVSFGHEKPSLIGKDLKLLDRDSFLNNLQICRLTSDVVDGIDGLVESFVREGCANGKLQSVCFEWADGDGPQSSSPKLLGKPTKTDEPLPKICLTNWLTDCPQRVLQCQMHSFITKKQWKRMEVHKWTVEYDYDDDDHRRTVHFLRCRVMSL